MEESFRKKLEMHKVELAKQYSNEQQYPKPVGGTNPYLKQKYETF